MGRDGKDALLGLAGVVLGGLLARKLASNRQTDQGFKPAREPGPDVFSGLEKVRRAPVGEDKVF